MKLMLKRHVATCVVDTTCPPQDQNCYFTPTFTVALQEVILSPVVSVFELLRVAHFVADFAQLTTVAIDFRPESTQYKY